MSERPEYNPEADPHQQRTVEIQNIFESQEFERGLQEFTAEMKKWSREEERQDAALELAKKVGPYREKFKEQQPNLLNRLDTMIAEAYLYAGDSENENLSEAEKRYEQVTETKLAELPRDRSTLPEAERTKYSEVFHALDRLGDVAFVGGRYQEAGERYADAIEERAEFADDPKEQGPLACAKFGQAASAFMQGDTSSCESYLAEAAEQLSNVEGEEELQKHVQRLADANKLFAELDESKRAGMLEKLDDIIQQKGGSEGGAKHINFEKTFAEAVGEASMNEE